MNFLTDDFFGVASNLDTGSQFDRDYRRVPQGEFHLHIYFGFGRRFFRVLNRLF